MKHFIPGLFALLMPLILIACSDEQSSAKSETVDKWYAALKASDRSAFNEIMTEDAIIEIKALGIIQTKAEFIESLNNWEDIAKSLKLSHTVRKASDTSARVEVCYEFPSNSFTNTESFTLVNGKVTSQVQELLKEGC